MDLARTLDLGASTPLSDLKVLSQPPGEGTRVMYSPSKIIRTASLIGAFVFVTISPTAQAVDPPPDGGYPNENAAEGQDSLLSFSDGSDNTANGFEALFSNTTGSENTANGSEALFSNSTGAHNTGRWLQRAP